MSRHFIVPIIFTLSLLIPLGVSAEEQEPTVSMVVTPDRIERPQAATASAITVITGEELKARGVTHVADALRMVPGVDVVRSGGAGGNTAVFMRGANSEHTLLLIDGVEANNPASPTRAFNFSDLSVNEIERIEVLRGPQSTLYGSDAIGGVIQIITKRAAMGPTAEISFEGGTYSSYTERAGVGYGTEALSGNVGFLRQDVDGFSAADERDGNSEDDGFENSSVAGRIEAVPTDWFKANFTLRNNDSRADIDNQGGVFGDDPNRRVNNEELFLKSEGIATLFDGLWESRLSFAYADHMLKDDNDPDLTHPDESLRSRYDGKLFAYGFQNNFNIAESFSLLAGVETEEEEASSSYHSTGSFGPFDDVLGDRRAHSTGYYSQALVSLGDYFSSTFGARIDDHSKFGSETTWRVAPVLRSTEWGTSLKASGGTGYKAPSLVQLYSSYGNPELEAEESLGFDVGIEQEFCDRTFVIESRYFWNEFDNLITFNPSTFVLENINEASSRGVETSLRASPLEELTTGITWTYTDTEDEETNLPLLRRARNKLSADISYRPIPEAQVVLTGVAAGSRPDNDFSTFPATRTDLAGYGLINVAASYQLTENIEITFRVDNLLDKNYQEVLGYGTAGASVFGGMRVKL